MCFASSKGPEVIRFIVCCVLSLFGLSPAQAQTKYPYQQTLILMRDEVLKHQEVASATIDAERQLLRVIFKDEAQVTFNPDNLDILLKAATSQADREETLRNFVAGFVSLHEGILLDPKHVLAVVRSVSIADQFPPDTLASVALVADLSIFFVIDGSDSLRFVMSQMSLNWLKALVTC
jgi:hypothetical protein